MENKIDKYQDFINESINDNILHINRKMTFNTNNWTPITGKTIEPYTYSDLTEDAIYIDTYIKGKRSKKIEDLRILIQGVNTKKYYMMFLKIESGIKGTLHYIGLHNFKEIDGMNHIKFKSYNYYLKDNNPSDLTKVLSEWFQLDKPHTSIFSVHNINNAPNYTYIFDYNGNKY